jgi:hypothetical protein
LSRGRPGLPERRFDSVGDERAGGPVLGDPEDGVADGELRDDVVSLTDAVKDARAKRGP